jgi:hypothetical protein
MASKYFTADHGPAKNWVYVGDGEWWAVADHQFRPEPAVGRRTLMSLPIDQLPRDGLISYTTSKGNQVTERVERGEVI